jgi:hypothetical protein
LFSDQTLKYDGTGLCADGFEALKQEDTNDDNVVNDQDDNWSNLRLWRDYNQNGKVDEGELSTLEEHGIIGLNVTPNTTAQDLGNGNSISSTGTYVKKDGSTGQMGDLNFFVNPAQREFIETIEVSDEIKNNLPNEKGSGLVRDLWDAAAQSNAVKVLFLDFIQSENRSEQRLLLEQLLTAWANTCLLAVNLYEHAHDQYEVRYIRFGQVL